MVLGGFFLGVCLRSSELLLELGARDDRVGGSMGGGKMLLNKSMGSADSAPAFVVVVARPIFLRARAFRANVLGLGCEKADMAFRLVGLSSSSPSLSKLELFSFPSEDFSDDIWRANGKVQCLPLGKMMLLLRLNCRPIRSPFLLLG